MANRRLLVPAATAVAVVVIATGAGVVASRHNDGRSSARAQVGSPMLPPLSIGAGSGVTAGLALGAPEGTRKLGAPVSAGGIPTVTIKGELPAAANALVPAYRFVRRQLVRDDIAKLADALGLPGKLQQQGAGWFVADNGRVLSVNPDPTLDWQLMPGEMTCGGGTTGSSGSGVVPGATGAPDIDIATPAGGVEAPAPGTATKPATEPNELNSEPTQVAPPPVGGDCALSTTVSSGVACAAPEGAETLVACPTPTAKPVASEDVARAAALALLKKVGVTAEAADVRVDEGYDGVRHVSVRRRVEGLPVEGMTAQIGVDASGAVVTASGQLAEPVLAGKYPMLPPTELAQHIADTRVRMMMCLQKPGVEGCAPPPPIVVTGASIGLSLAFPADYDKGDAYLLPAWLFTIEGDPQPSAVVAVPSQYRTDPVPPATEGGNGKSGGIKPMPPQPAPPATAPVPAPESAVMTTPPAKTKDNPLTTVAVALPTSTWKDGDGARAAQAGGTLAIDANGCLGLTGTGNGARLTPLLWPAGYVAEMTGDSLVVKSATGEVVARTGERLTVGGGLAGHPVAESSMSPAISGCGTAEAWAIQDPGPYND